MAIEKTTRLEAIQFTDDGTLLVRMQKRVIVDGEVMKEEWHRTAIPPDTDPDEQMNMVNAHLAAMGHGPVSAKHVDIVRAATKVEHTPARKEAYKAKIEAAKIAANLNPANVTMDVTIPPP